MKATTAQELGKQLIEQRLVSREEVADAVEAAGTAAPGDLLRVLERRNLLTSFQIQKLENDDRAGYFIGRFKVLYKISAGTFARVFRGVDTATGDSVAIKVLRNRHTLDPENVKHFYREAKLTEKLDHPNIARRLDVGCDKSTNQHYIAMEFVEGGNFREFLKIRQKVDPRELARLGVEMVEGLKYALSMGVTHRDVKPTNILFTSTGHIKWVDFGLAGIADRAGTDAIFATEQRTVDYAGLEKATGSPNGDPRSDIFFLGCVFYEALTGVYPLTQPKDRNARMLRNRFDQIRPVAEAGEVPPEMARIVDRMLAFRPEARYANYDALSRDLQQFESAGAAAAGGEAGRPRNRIILIHASQTVQDRIRKTFGDHGMKVALTGAIERAESLHRLQGADCMIIDLDTIGEHGVSEFETFLKKLPPRGPKCPAIFLANEGQEAWVSRLDAEQTVVLQKPLTLGLVYRAVRQFLPRN